MVKDAIPTARERILRLARTRALGPVVLLWSLRMLSLYMLVSAGAAWVSILGASTPTLIEMPTHMQTVTVYFALLKTIAAVGLWFGAGWGVASWLFVVVSEMVLHVGFADLFGTAWGLATFHVTTILAYLGLAWWAGAPENSGDGVRIPPD